MTRAAWLLGIEAAAIAAALTVSLDLRAHGRVEALGGVNEWGYRGPVAPHRQPNEIRVAVVGGTRAFGWGLPGSPLVAEIRRVVMLTTDRPGADVRPVVVINLGRLGALPASYPETIERYAYLRADYICLYDDLGVPGGSPMSGTDGASAVFRLTGYAPALPLVLREKGMVWRFGDVQIGYAPEAVRSKRGTSLMRGAAGAMLEGVGGALEAADRRIARMLAGRDSAAGAPDAADYTDAMMRAIDAAHRLALGVVVVLSPAETARQAANRRALDVRLATPAGVAPWLRVVDLAGDSRLAGDLTLRLDGWNYASAGVGLVASRIAPALLSLIPKS
jgi:hypothetical protein